jgi:hypothetical protein
MIRQKRAQFPDLAEEKMHEKLLPNDEMRTYDYDQKHFQPPSA